MMTPHHVPGIEDRDALYYPYIHFRDEQWLRSTLLFFPHVLRMTPPEYGFRDGPFVKALCQTRGRRDEPLVGNYSLNSDEAVLACYRLAERLRQDVNSPAFRQRFSREAALREYRDDESFQIHRDKFAMPLLDTLEEARLVWHPERARRHGSSWLATHPKIGEVITSTLAAAVAVDRGCDVLTDHAVNHVVSATRDEEEIYGATLGTSGWRRQAHRPDEVQIGNLVLSTTFDLSALKPADFEALSSERDALFDFRALLSEKVARIPATLDHDARLARAREAAEEIVAAWEARRRTFGNFMKRLLRLEAAEQARSTAEDLLALGFASMTGVATLGSTAGSAVLAGAPGLAIGLVFCGARTWRDMQNQERAAPTRFLNLVEQRGGTLIAASSS